MGGGVIRDRLMATTCQPPTAAPEVSSSSGRSSTEMRRSLKVHSEAERRRRERINAHLATLRRMIPDASQMDKASLLASVVNQVKDLKRKTTARTTTQAAAAAPIPPEANEVTVRCCCASTGGDRATYVRATVSCEDGPGLLAGLAAAFRGLGLRALRAEVASLGGRAHHEFLLRKEEEDGDLGAGMRLMEAAVRQALAEVAFPEMARGGSGGSWSKRQRLLEARCSVMYSV